MQTRREFGRNVLIVGGAALVLPEMLLSEGCTVNAESLLNTVIDSIMAILKVAEPTASWFPTLSAALAALQAAANNWKKGGAATIVIEALDTVENVLAVIPVTAVYSPLVAVLVVGITAVLNALPVSLKMASKVNLRTNVYVNRVQLRKRRFWQTYQGAYRSQWNEVADGLGLPAAKI